MTDDTTPADPEMTPEEAMREAAAAIASFAYDRFLACYEVEYNRKRYDVDGVERARRKAAAIISEDIEQAIRALPLSTPVVAHQGAESDRQAARVNRAAIDAAYAALPPDACGTIAEGEMERVLERAFAALSPTPGAETPGQPVTLTYTNWRGETAERTILPLRLWYGATEWHPAPQWLLAAMDVEKEVERDFALKDFGQPPAETDAAAIRAARADGMREAVPIFLTAADPGPPEDGNYAQTWAVHLQIKGAKAVHAAANELAIPQPTPEPQGWRPLTDMPEDGTWAVLYPGFYGPFTACAIFGKWTMCDDGDLNLATMWRPCPFPAAPMTGEEEIRE